MAGRHFHLSNGALFLLLVGAGVVLLALPRSLTERLNFLFAETFEPVIRIGRHFSRDTDAPAGAETPPVLRREYNELLNNYRNLHAQLLKLQENYETLARVRGSVPQFYSGLVLADVVRTGPTLTHELLLNKGAAEGIRPGQYVMSPGQNSIIGVVQATSEHMARVRLLTDANQSIEIRIRRARTPLDVGALMFGNGRRGCTVSMVERETDIRVGDAVYAAARPGILDVAMVIGQVSDVQPDEESPLLWKIAVEPSEHVSSLSTAAVIVPDTLGSGRR